MTISGKDEQSLSASTDTARKGVNISSDYNPLNQGIPRETKANITGYPVEATRPEYVHKSPAREEEAATLILQHPADSEGITYVAAKGSNQTVDRNRHEFLNASRISESAVVTNSADGGREERVRDAKNDETGNNFTRQEPLPRRVSLGNAGGRGNPAKSPSLPREAEVSRNDSPAVGEHPPTWGSYVEEPDESPSRLIVSENVTTGKSADLGIADHSELQSRTEQEEEPREASEDDLVEAANFGLQAMHELYHVQEPKLYSMGKHEEREGNDRLVAKNTSP